MLGVVAAVSQVGVNTMQGSKPFSGMASGIKRKIVAISPMKSLSDQEYEDLLHEKLLRVNAEIGILDDQIAALRLARGQPSSIRQEASRNHPS